MTERGAEGTNIPVLARDEGAGGGSLQVPGDCKSSPAEATSAVSSGAVTVLPIDPGPCPSSILYCDRKELAVDAR